MLKMVNVASSTTVPYPYVFDVLVEYGSGNEDDYTRELETCSRDFRLGCTRKISATKNIGTTKDSQNEMQEATTLRQQAEVHLDDLQAKVFAMEIRFQRLCEEVDILSMRTSHLNEKLARYQRTIKVSRDRHSATEGATEPEVTRE